MSNINEDKDLGKKIDELLIEESNGKKIPKCELINEGLNKILNQINKSFDFDLFPEEKLDDLEKVKILILFF